MLAVIFEVWPRPEKKDQYLKHAGELRSIVESIDGYLSVERFESITDENKMLSLSFFDTDKALDEWRNTAEHRVAQQLGRSDYFADYRLRIARVERDYGMDQRREVPQDSKAVHS